MAASAGDEAAAAIRRAVSAEHARVLSSTVSPCGRHLLLGLGGGEIVMCGGYLGAFEGKARPRALKRHAAHVCGLVFLGAESLASCARDGLRLWRWAPAGATALTELHVLKPAADTTCLASSENGATLFAGAVDGSCGVWDVAKQTRVVQLNAHAGAVLSVAALGAHTLATGGEDGVVRLWDARSGKVARAFLPATGASRVEPEDAVARAAAAMSAPAAAAAAAPAAVTCVASGAGGEWLLAGGTARFLTLWHVGTAAPTSVFPTGGVPQQALLLGDRVAAVATDGVLYQWTVRGASLSARRSVHIRSLFTLARAPASSGAQEPPLVAGGASPFVDVYVYGNAYSFSIDIAPALHAQA